MCEYQGYEFGAHYLDSVCIDGQLYDADNCDDQGNLYEPMEDIPCPVCRPKDSIVWWTDRFDGNGSRRKARKSARFLVADIRRNRGIETLTNPTASMFRR